MGVGRNLEHDYCEYCDLAGSGIPEVEPSRAYQPVRGSSYMVSLLSSGV
jgi:hypothetical protein